MFNKSKKIICSILALSMMTLVGCGTSEGDTGTQSNVTVKNDEKVTLTVWHYYNGNTKDTFDELIATFNSTVGLEKNIAVEAYSYSSVSNLSGELVASARKEVGKDDMPDIFASYSDTALLLNDMGVIADMDLYFSDSELSLFHQDFLNEGRFDEDGGLKIIPVAKSTEHIFLNETDFEIFASETGVTVGQIETWEGMAEVAEIYYNWTDAKTPEENDGRAFFGIDSEANFMLVAARQLGDEMYDYAGDDVSFGLSEDSAKQIWDTFMIPYINGYYASLGSYRSDDVKSGDLLAYVGSTSSVSYYPTTVELGKEATYDIVGTSMPYPYFDGGEKIVVQQGAGFVVSKSDETHEASAAEFLKWFTATENNLDFAVSTGYIPVKNDALSYENVVSIMGDELPNVVLSSVDVTYNDMLPEYEFYSNKPFDGSYDTRSAIQNSITQTISEALSEISTQVGDGADRQEVISKLTDDEAFSIWYEGLANSIIEILAQN